MDNVRDRKKPGHITICGIPMDTVSIRLHPDDLATFLNPSARPLSWTLEQTAQQLGISPRTLFALRDKHPLYAPDSTRNIDDDPKKARHMWSDELVKLIAFARTMTAQGARQLSDDEALKVRNSMGEARRREYLAFISE